MREKTALITGITGQDGSYLADFLLRKNYCVHGIKRRASLTNTQRIKYLCSGYQDKKPDLYLHEGDLTDTNSIVHILQKSQPDEIYNLAAQSHVMTSFEMPEYTANTAGLGTLRLLEALRLLKLERKVRFYQASSSELFGRTEKTPQNEETPFYPCSPYAIAKLFSYWTTINYREAYGAHASNGILFNHESPLRGESFVSRKITKAVGRIKLGLQKKMFLGNLNAKRDWGFAGDYVEAMWLMLQQDKPDDYVVATGEMYTVKQFCERAFALADIKLTWKGEGVEEKGFNKETGEVIIEIDSGCLRPMEVNALLGDYSKAKKKLGWNPKVKFDDLVKMMVAHDLKEASLEKYAFKRGYLCKDLAECGQQDNNHRWLL